MKLFQKQSIILLVVFFFNFNINFWLISQNDFRTLRSESEIFSQTFFKTLDKTNFSKEEQVWECNSVEPFTELILSWNALRPTHGKYTFWISVKHLNWSNWQRIAEWSANSQRTFVNKLNSYVHTKHVRVEMQRGMHATGFRVKVNCQKGAEVGRIEALFVCTSDLKKFKGENYFRLNLASTLVRGVPRYSQMVLDHPRYRDLCSPTSTGLTVNYFMRKIYGRGTENLSNYLVSFADKVHDNGYLDIYGSWSLNAAQAYDSTSGNVFFRVERLNSFKDLYRYISRDIPVIVSVRKLRGGATPYTNGHFMIVVGWDQKKQAVLCIDPAFAPISQTPKAYKLRNFLNAWRRSSNLTYVPLPKDRLSEFV